MKKSSGKVASLLAVTAISMAVAAPASAIVVGGINFGVLGGSPSNIHLETTTLAQQIITGDGQNSLAYGVISTVNGASNYCGAGATNDCTLYYVANVQNSQNFSPSYVEFTQNDVAFYYDPNSSTNLLNQDSVANLAFITGLAANTGGNPWLSLTGHANLGGVADPAAVVNANGLLAGASLSFLGSGLLDVDTTPGTGLADVQAFWDANSIADAAGGFADVAFTSSANNLVLNPFDISNGLANSCGSETTVTGDWCFQGTINMRGQTVTDMPEPGLIALLGIGLLGMTAANRRKKF